MAIAHILWGQVLSRSLCFSLCLCVSITWTLPLSFSLPVFPPTSFFSFISLGPSFVSVLSPLPASVFTPFSSFWLWSVLWLNCSSLCFSRRITTNQWKNQSEQRGCLRPVSLNLWVMSQNKLLACFSLVPKWRDNQCFLISRNLEGRNLFIYLIKFIYSHTCQPKYRSSGNIKTPTE